MMSLKSIFVAVSGGTASDGAVDLACRLARQFGAALEGFHVKTDPTQIIMLATEGYNMPIAGEWIDRLIADTDELAKKTKSAFAATAARHGLSTAGAALWREETGYAPVLVARRARFFDLAVLGRSERIVERPHTDSVEETLIHSGRPVLLAPAKPPAAVGETIAVGWNGSPEAVHVIAASLPLLAAAKSVSVITVGEEPDDSVPELLHYLAAHGVKGQTHHVMPVKGVGPGEQLLAEAHDGGADLLVMGGYGHRPWREVVFGGATRQVVGTSLLPVLLAH
jgi:nucleotide-binding universal stress UspA family protein